VKGPAKQEDIDRQEFLPKDDLDFYWEPLRACWYTDGEGDEISPLQAPSHQEADRPVRSAGDRQDVSVAGHCRWPDPAGVT
jgi:hypothetical protein